MERGLAPAILAIVERGVRRRPELAGSLQVEVELAVHGGYPPVRVLFEGRSVLVEDGPAVDPDLRVEGELADLISLLVARLWPAGCRCRSPRAAGLLWAWWRRAGYGSAGGSASCDACWR